MRGHCYGRKRGAGRGTERGIPRLHPAGKGIAAPEVLPYEVGNTLVAVNRRGRLTDQETLRAFDRAGRIAITLLPVAIPEALGLAMRFGLYAYDAYYLQCCIENRTPLPSPASTPPRRPAPSPPHQSAIKNLESRIG